MGRCLINNLNDLSNLNRCEFNPSGISRIFIGAYSNTFYQNMVIMGNYISDLEQATRFVEVDFNKGTTKYDDNYNYDLNKYEINLNLELLNMDWEKRNIIDSLIKSKLIIIFKNVKGKYFLIGEKVGITSNKFTSTSDVSGGKSGYIFNFNIKQDYLPFGIAEDLVIDLTKISCEDINHTLALGNQFLWSPYAQCLVKNFDGFTEP